MNESEFQTIYQELVEILRGLELGWLVEQVGEHVSLGKAASKGVMTLEQIRYQEALPGLPPEYEREYEVIFATTVEYTSQERLLMLVDALKHALVNTAYMAFEFTRFFSEERAELGKVGFYQAGELVTFTPESTAFRKNHAVYLRRLLDELHAGVSRGAVVQSFTIAKVASAIEKAVEPALKLESLASNLFEAYIFSLIMRAAKAESAKISYQDLHGNAPTALEFMADPGMVCSSRPYTHAVIEFPHKPVLEAQIGARLAGRSQVLHDSSIALLLQSEAEICRENQVSPRSSKAILAAVCKFHSTCVPLHLARAFIGLEADLAARDCYFVVNTLSPSVGRLLDHHRKYWEHQIFPGSTTAVVRLQNMFQTFFRNFKARF
jgi:hypothetical protein